MLSVSSVVIASSSKGMTPSEKLYFLQYKCKPNDVTSCSQVATPIVCYYDDEGNVVSGSNSCPNEHKPRLEDPPTVYSHREIRSVLLEDCAMDSPYPVDFLAIPLLVEDKVITPKMEFHCG